MASNVWNFRSAVVWTLKRTTSRQVYHHLYCHTNASGGVELCIPLCQSVSTCVCVSAFVPAFMCLDMDVSNIQAYIYKDTCVLFKLYLGLEIYKVRTHARTHRARQQDKRKEHVKLK